MIPTAKKNSIAPSSLLLLSLLPLVPNSTSLAEARFPSGPVMAVSVCPQRGPGASPTQGKRRGRGTGAGGVEASTASMSADVDDAPPPPVPPLAPDATTFMNLLLLLGVSSRGEAGRDL